MRPGPERPAQRVLTPSAEQRQQQQPAPPTQPHTHTHRDDMAKLALLLVLANMTGLLSPSGVGTYTSSSSSAAAAEPVGASGVLDSRDPFRAVGVDTFALSAISLHIHTRTHTRVKSKNQVREVRRFVCGGHCGAATQQRRKHGGQNEGMHRKPLNIAKNISFTVGTHAKQWHARNKRLDATQHFLLEKSDTQA